MKIVFLDEYSVCGRDLSTIKRFGDYTGYEVTSPEQVVERCADAEVVISNKVVLDATIIASLPKLRLICVAATGMNNIDLNAAAEHGVEVRNAVGYSTYSVAETTICSALSLLREVTYYDNYFKSGEYAKSERIFNFDRPTAQLRGKRWGIIGMGNIGREVARLAEAFGCDVAYFSTSGVERNEAYNKLSLNELLNSSEMIMQILSSKDLSALAEIDEKENERDTRMQQMSLPRVNNDEEEDEADEDDESAMAMLSAFSGFGLG